MSDYCKEDGGIFFDPSDKELIEYYLVRKLRGETSGDDFILDKDVYAKEPWLLDHSNYPFFKEDEWYYFVIRTQISEKNIGCGKNSKRKITGDNDGGGSWKPNAKEDIIDEKTKKIIGEKKTLTFTKSKNHKKKQQTGDGTSCAIVPGSDSSWIMTEYMLPEGDKFQELVLCKIHKIKKSKKKSKKKGDHHEPSEEGNMVHQVDALSTIGTVPKRPSEKDSQAGAMEVTQEVEEDLIGDLMENYTSKGLEDMAAAFSGLTRDEEDAPNMEWMDQDQLLNL